MDPRFALNSAEDAKVAKQCQAASLKLCEVDVSGQSPYPPSSCRRADPRANRPAAFAACAEGRTVSVTWKCRKEFRKMQGCMAV